MNKLFKTIRHYPLSCLCIVGIWVLCLIPIPETPLSDIRFIDKWTHFVFYGGLCSVLWCEYGHRHKKGSKSGNNKSNVVNKTTLLWIIIAPIIMGGMIELAQAYCTGGNRNGDVLDWAADTVGVVIGQVIGIPLALWLSRWNKGSEAC